MPDSRRRTWIECEQRRGTPAGDRVFSAHFMCTSSSYLPVIAPLPATMDPGAGSRSRLPSASVAPRPSRAACGAICYDSRYHVYALHQVWHDGQQ